MSDEGLVSGQSAPASAGLPGAPQAEGARVEPVVHYSYLGLAMLLFGTIAGGSLYHVSALASRLEVAKKELPALSVPLFNVISRLGWLVFLPLGAFVLLEVVMPRKLTKLWLASTLLLLLVGVYVAIALWLAARGPVAA
ncbi:MAG: hypothetical protein K8T20_01805 [Planctomycetes bacterium]|nr:hypothetical protein [Planctomycetota bacterium]